MAVNVPLLRKVMEHIENHPDEHNQKMWAIRNECGTAYCFAGHTVIMSGWRVLFEPYGNGNLWAGACKNPETGARVTISKAAAGLLGISPELARMLFNETNSADFLRFLVDEIIEGVYT